VATFFGTQYTLLYAYCIKEIIVRAILSIYNYTLQQSISYDAYVCDVLVKPLTPTVVIWVKLIKHLVPDRVKPSFVNFDVRAL